MSDPMYVKRPEQAESRSVVPRSWGIVTVTASGYRVLFQGDRNVLELDRNDDCTTF